MLLLARFRFGCWPRISLSGLRGRSLNNNSGVDHRPIWICSLVVLVLVFLWRALMSSKRSPPSGLVPLWHAALYSRRLLVYRAETERWLHTSKHKKLEETMLIRSVGAVSAIVLALLGAGCANDPNRIYVGVLASVHFTVEELGPNQYLVTGRGAGALSASEVEGAYEQRLARLCGERRPAQSETKTSPYTYTSSGGGMLHRHSAFMRSGRVTCV